MKNPFPGLRPYQSDEFHLFFGRSLHIDTILSKLHKFRFVSVVGNSGSGKSSLVRAGVLPTLVKEDGTWVIVTLRPGQDPVAELAEGILASSLGEKSENKSISDALAVLNKGDRGLVQWLRGLLPEGQKLLILVDQFEELFRFSRTAEDISYRERCDNFVQLLLRGIEQKDLPIYMMMTIRSDFLGDCEQFDGLPEAINDGQFLIPRMNRNELMECITRPVEVAGGKIAPRLVNSLLDRIGNNPDQLPVLQHVLMRSWETWEEENDFAHPIDLVHYEKTGGMEKALSNHAEEAYAELEREGLKPFVARMFKALTMKGSDNRGVRRPCSVDKLALIAETSPETIMHIANAFRRADRGLLMPPENKTLTEESILDISHESLMRIWDRLRTWVDEEAESAELYQRISESTSLYLQDKSGLWTDPDLQIALDWQKKQQPNEFWASQYDTSFARAMHFIKASAEHKHFVLADKKRKNRLLMASLLGVLLILSMLTIWAISERSSSQKNALLAQAEQKKAEAQKQLAEQNFLKAEKERKNAQAQKQIAEVRKTEAEGQRQIALENEKEARLQKLLAEKATIAANDARKRAELDKQIAVLQKQISDSLKGVAEISEKQIYRSRILSLAQNLSIKSANATATTYAEPVKSLLALQAVNFNNKYNIKDKDARQALISAYQAYETPNEKAHTAHTGVITGIAVAKGNKVASCSEDGTVVTCNSTLPGTYVRFPKQPYIFKQITYNEQGDKIACVADNRSIFIFNALDATSKPVVIPPAHTDQITGLAWKNDRIYTVGVDKKLMIYDPAKSVVIESYPLPERPTCLAMSDNGKGLLLGYETGLVQVLDAKNAEVNFALTLKGRIQAVCFLKDLKHLAVGNYSGQLYLINEDQSTIINAHKSGISGLSYSSKDGLLASVSYDGLVKIWNMAHTDEDPIVFTEHEGSWLYSVVFSDDKKYLLAGGKDKYLRSYLVDDATLYDKVKAKTTRNFSKEEWQNFVGQDIPYEKTLIDK